MSSLLKRSVYGPREDGLLLEELNALTRHHLEGCPAYRRVWPHWSTAPRFEDLPFLHVGIFKHLIWKTAGPGIQHQRLLLSSATTSGISSQIVLDTESSLLQAESAKAIFQHYLGNAIRPLLILDSARSLQRRGEISARIAAAMSLKPLASDLYFLLKDSDNPESLQWDVVEKACRQNDEVLIYGFTWMLWLAWARGEMPLPMRDLMRHKRIVFVHSGGWKKLENLEVNRKQLEEALLETAGPGSLVLDFYGLVEQTGLIYPLCAAERRHVPVWAQVLVRDPHSLQALPPAETGMLQLLNSLAWGAPYHSVLTEDLGMLLDPPCPCGLSGPSFQLQGRIPKAEIRGCANV